eukprot:scaffold4410_cov78-Cylindrotheca_fusiformis.AAC.5
MNTSKLAKYHRLSMNKQLGLQRLRIQLLVRELKFSAKMCCQCDPEGNGVMPSPPGKPTAAAVDDLSFPQVMVPSLGQSRSWGAMSTIFVPTMLARPFLTPSGRRFLAANHFAKHNPNAGKILKFDELTEPTRPTDPTNLVEVEIWKIDMKEYCRSLLERRKRFSRQAIG